MAAFKWPMWRYPEGSGAGYQLSDPWAPLASSSSMTPSAALGCILRLPTPITDIPPSATPSLPAPSDTSIHQGPLQVGVLTPRYPYGLDHIEYSPKRTTTLPGTALGRTTSTTSVLLAFFPFSRSERALDACSTADLMAGTVSAYAAQRERCGRPGFLMAPIAGTLPTRQRYKVKG